MFFRYNFLNRFVGSGVVTHIVLFKCFLDQLFFATQQDFLFLALCAYSSAEKLNQAIEEVKSNLKIKKKTYYNKLIYVICYQKHSSPPG
jgi:hypothetical protein